MGEIGRGSGNSWSFLRWLPHGNLVRPDFFVDDHPHVLSHLVVVGAVVLAIQVVFAAPDTRVLVYLTRLFVFIEDRLSRRIINPQLISRAPNWISFQNEFKKLLATLVANVVIGAFSALSLWDDFSRLLNRIRLSLDCCTFLIHGRLIDLNKILLSASGGINH